jgi:predicted Zn-ribbon and HTH transcriptional regulator
MIHENSKLSYQEEIEQGHPQIYRERIVELLKTSVNPMTDREVMIALGVDEKSNILPEITRLVQKGILYEHDRVKCSYTGKTVRRTTLFLKCPHCNQQFQLFQAKINSENCESGDE